MTIAGLVLAALAALVHVYIFYMESIAWTAARTRATFGTTETEAETTKALAFNQGFYNLFLAIFVVIGIISLASGASEAGYAFVVAGAGAMVAAATVLFLSDATKRGAALKQGLIPAVGLVLIAVGAAL